MGHQLLEILRCRNVVVNEIQTFEHLGCNDEAIGHLNPQTLKFDQVQPLVTQVDDIVAELADVLEVIDGILDQLDVDKGELLDKQKRKKEKAGGFKDGIVLVETENPLPAKVGGENEIELFEAQCH